MITAAISSASGRPARERGDRSFAFAIGRDVTAHDVMNTLYRMLLAFLSVSLNINEQGDDLILIETHAAPYNDAQT
jgi:hypothetical protein